MHNLFVIDHDSESILKGATILFDTNVLIDSWLFQAEFADLLAKFRACNCYLTTTKQVVIEFLGGTKSESNISEKVKFLETVFAKPISGLFLPSDKASPIEDEFLEFSRQANKFSVTDFELFWFLKKYSRSGLLLMTRNHSDFTAPTFERKGFITLLGKNEIHTHGLYAYHFEDEDWPWQQPKFIELPDGRIPIKKVRAKTDIKKIVSLLQSIGARATQNH